MRTGILIFTVFFALGIWAAPPPTESQRVDETVKVTAQVPQTIPAAARNLKNPVSAGPESLARGKRLFNSQCTMCHGDTGKGDGSLAARLAIEVPPFAVSARTRTDGEMFYVIRSGHGSMPAEDRLDDEWLWDMVNYIRSLTASS